MIRVGILSIVCGTLGVYGQNFSCDWLAVSVEYGFYVPISMFSTVISLRYGHYVAQSFSCE